MLYEDYIDYKQIEDGGYRAKVNSNTFNKVLNDLQMIAQDYKKEFKELYCRKTKIYQYWGIIKDFKYSLCRWVESDDAFYHQLDEYTIYARKID